MKFYPPPLPSFALLLSQLVIFVYTLLKLWLEFLSLLRIFHSFRDVSIAVERLQMLTYVQHLWPLSSGGSLACHTYCNTGHPRTRTITPNAERLAIELSLLNDYRIKLVYFIIFICVMKDILCTLTTNKGL